MDLTFSKGEKESKRREKRREGDKRREKDEKGRLRESYMNVMMIEAKSFHGDPGLAGKIKFF